MSALETDTREIKAILGRLEPLLRGVDDRLRKVEVHIAELKGRVSQLPTTMQIVTYMTGLLGFGLALAGAVLGFARYFRH